MILITRFGEFTFIILFKNFFFYQFVNSGFRVYFFLGNPNPLGRIVSWSLGVCPVFAVGIYVPVSKEF